MTFKRVVANVTNDTVKVVSEMWVTRVYGRCDAEFSWVFYVRAIGISWVLEHSISFNIED